MTWEEAIKYCEDHECKNCIVYDMPDCRTEYEKVMLHAPCCINLVDANLRYFNNQSRFTEEEKLSRRKALEKNSTSTGINIFNL